MKVRVLPGKTGFYPTKTPLGEDWKRRREGDVFTLHPRDITPVDVHSQKPILDGNGKPVVRHLTVEDQFSVNWMERVEEETPESLTSAQEALSKANADILSSRRPSRARA